MQEGSQGGGCERRGAPSSAAGCRHAEPPLPPPADRSLQRSASNLFVLTGTSRGIGEALAELLLEPANLVVCVTRTPSDALEQRAAASSARLEQWPQDLGYPIQAAARLEAWLQAQDADVFQTATLINSAAVIALPGPCEEADPEEIVNTLRVGLETPMLLTAAFLRATRQWICERKVLNVSSSLGRRAMTGLSSYCAVKAGIDHYSRVVALDEALKPSGARIVSLAPGSVDTDLQAQLRAADRSKFPDGDRFERLKREGRLPSSAQAAARVLEYLRRNDFGVNPVADVLDVPARLESFVSGETADAGSQTWEAKRKLASRTWTALTAGFAAGLAVYAAVEALMQ